MRWLRVNFENIHKLSKIRHNAHGCMTALAREWKGQCPNQTWGCGQILGLVYAVNPRLFRYSMGLREPREILIRFSLYQRM